MQTLFRTLLFPLLVTALSTAANTACQANPAAISDVQSFVQQSFDYLIIGGGTAGVALSARLSEDPSVVVGLIEAGTTHFNDTLVDAPAISGQLQGNPLYDWLFVSTPQPHANGQILTLPRGKMLGGSSGINTLVWGRGSSAEYDAWNSFAANQGWTWSGLLPYMKKSETFSLEPKNPYPGISEQDAEKARQDLPRVDGFSGPINASYISFYFDTVRPMVEAFNGLGIRTNPEPQGGNATGVTNTLLSIDPIERARSYSATTYFCSHSQNRNYHVLLNAQATKILFSNTTSGLTATDVQFIVGNNTFSAGAKREIILSAGADQSPQLLELSGIGNSSILTSHGIKPLIDLPGVGENFQDQVVSAVEFELKPGIETFDAFRNNATFAMEQTALYAANHTGLLAASDSLLTFVPLAQIVNNTRLTTLLDTFDQGVQNGSLNDVAQLQAKFLRRWFAGDSIGSIEFIQRNVGIVNPAANKSYVTLLGVLLHPISRGSVHIGSNNPLTPPIINPNWLAEDFDVQAVLDMLKFSQKIGQTEPFASLVVAQTNPSLSAQTDEELIEYIRGSRIGDNHHIGSATMAPRQLGGVVDGSLKVYGTANLRIVDASVIPNSLGAHIQTAVYAIAEKAADMIKASNSDLLEDPSLPAQLPIS